MSKNKEHQNDLFSEEDKINGMKKKVYDQLTIPFRRACLEFVELRHDHQNRTHMEDLEDLLLFAKSEPYTFECRFKEILDKYFKHWWRDRKWNGGWR